MTKVVNVSTFIVLYLRPTWTSILKKEIPFAVPILNAYD